MPPVTTVDLVMMSKATTPDLATMTQRAVDTAVFGAEPHCVKPIVMEQGRARYKRAETIYMPGHFNYNAFANHGIKEGNAHWIVVANNDLVFDPGWLDALLRANYSVVSPISPGYHRQINVFGNERGWQVGRHLSGWCHMFPRWLWEHLGGLDESYEFWCSDNAFMAQLKNYGIMPMLVPNSIVRHQVSATLSRETYLKQDELTWQQVHRFNAETGANALQTDSRYHLWLMRNGMV